MINTTTLLMHTFSPGGLSQYEGKHKNLIHMVRQSRNQFLLSVACVVASVAFYLFQRSTLSLVIGSAAFVFLHFSTSDFSKTLKIFNNKINSIN